MRIIWETGEALAVEEDGKLVEYIRTEEDGQSGSILMGRVERMMSGMECAFVDIGRKKSGFLPFREMSTTFTGQHLRSGEIVPVQIRREETGEKGAYLTRDLSIAGKYLLLMPMNRYIGVSRRIGDGEIRSRLLRTGKEIARDRFGLVLRAAASQADPRDIREEAENLLAVWAQVQERAAMGGCPGSVLYTADAREALEADYAPRGIDRTERAEALPPELERQRREAEGRRIRLPGGGNIVVDRCEAMTVIDVNTAGARNAGDKETTVLQTNLEACREAAAQIRLRDIGGIILIDFIDMDLEKDRSLILDTMQEALLQDRRKTVIHGWTHLGIMEITRKRV